MYLQRQLRNFGRFPWCIAIRGRVNITRFAEVYIENILLRYNMDTKKLVGTAFDGASSMVRLAKLLKKTLGENVIYIHCFAHCNEPVVKVAPALSWLVADAQDLCEDFYVLVGLSPKRALHFENIQKEITGSSERCPDVLRIKNLGQDGPQEDQQLRY